MITPSPAVEPGPAGRQVRLRPITPQDQRTLAGFDRDSAGEDAVRVGGYRHWAAHRASSGEDLQFGIETLRGRILVGSLHVIQAGPHADRFSYGIGIGPAYRRCGYAGDAVTALLALMFSRHGFRECEVTVFGGNLASLALHGSLGFRERARLRDAELLLGEVKYPVIMTISAAEFALRHPDFASARGPRQARRGRHWRNRRGRHWESGPRRASG